MVCVVSSIAQGSGQRNQLCAASGAIALTFREATWPLRPWVQASDALSLVNEALRASRKVADSIVPARSASLH